MKKITAVKLVMFARKPWLAFLGVGLVMAVVLGVFFPAKPASAATSSTINFQARLLSNAGNLVPDGNYNVEFKIYNALTSSGSSQGSCTGDANCLWTETRTSTNQVRVVNGYLTVNLGSVTSLPSINWDQPMWLSMNIGGTGGSPTWDGEMSPRLQLTAVPYAFRAGQLATNSGGNVATLGFTTPTANDSILLPDASGTVCLQASSSCGFATGSGSSSYIQNGSSPQTASFNITGTGKVSVLDSTGTSLSLGPSATGGITLQQNTTLASGKTLTIQGNATIQPASNGTSVFSVLTSGGANAFTVDTTNGRVGINLGSSNLPNAALEVNGALRLSGTAQDTFTTPGSASVPTKINIPIFDPGSFGQIIALGIPSTAQTTARVISIFDARTTAHQPSIGIFYPNESNIVGLSTEGTNSTGYLKTTDASGNLALRVGTTDLLIAQGSNSSIGIGIAPSYKLDVNGDVNIASGSAYKINGTNICTASGCTPAAGSSNYIQNTASVQSANLYVQAASSGSVAGVFRANAAGTGDVLDLLNGSGTTVASVGSAGATLFKPSTNSATAFQIQPAASATPVLDVDTSNGRVGIGLNNPAHTLDVVGDINSSTALLVAGTSVCDTIGGVGCIAKTGSGFYIHNQTGVQSANLYVQAATSGSVAGTFRANASGSGDTLDLLNGSGTAVATFGSTGNALFENSTNSTSAFQVQNASGSPVLGIDTTSNATNLITNPSFVTNTTGWVGRSGCVLTRATTPVLFGTGSGQCVDTGGGGFNYPLTLTANAPYTVSVYVRASAAFSTFNFGYAYNGSDETTYASTANTVSNNGWTRLSFSFTPTTISGTPYLFFYQSDATGRTIYIDGAQVETRASVWPSMYEDSRVTLDGTVVTPLNVQNAQDSTTSLLVNSAAGDNVLGVDTLNEKVGIGLVGTGANWANSKLYVVTASLVGTRILETGSSDALELANNTSDILDVSSTGALTTKTTTNSATALQVKNSGANPVLTVDTNSTNNRVVIGSGTTGEATPNLLVLDNSTSSSDPATVVSGAMYYNATTKSFRCGVNPDGSGNGWRDCTGLGFANTTQGAATTNTTTLTNWTTGLGYSMLPGDCQPGVVYLITASGLVSSTTANANTGHVYLNYDDTSHTIATTPGFSFSASVTNSPWQFNAQIICQTTGTSGTIEAQGIVEYPHDGNLPGASLLTTSTTNAGPVTFNTTTAHTLYIGWKWLNAFTSSSVTLRQFIVQRLGPQ